MNLLLMTIWAVSSLLLLQQLALLACQASFYVPHINYFINTQCCKKKKKATPLQKKKKKNPSNLSHTGFHTRGIFGNIYAQHIPRSRISRSEGYIHFILAGIVDVPIYIYILGSNVRTCLIAPTMYCQTFLFLPI